MSIDKISTLYCFLDNSGLKEEALDLVKLCQTIEDISDGSVVLRPETFDSLLVAHVQAMLEHLGHEVGDTGIDGDFGRGTFRAVREFQSSNGVPSTGVVNSDTIDLLKEKAPNVPVPTEASLLSRSSGERIFEKKKTEEEAGEDLKGALDILDEIIASKSFSGYSDDLQNVSVGKKAKVEGMHQNTKDLIGLINEFGIKMNTKVKITSAFRSPADQARIMHHNWNRRGGVGDGTAYLLSLYNRFKNIRDIASAFEKTSLPKQTRIQMAESIIERSWKPFQSHLSGQSLDISWRTGRYKVGLLLGALRQRGIIRVLTEDDHWHITAKEVPSPGGRAMV